MFGVSVCVVCMFVHVHVCVCVCGACVCVSCVVSAYDLSRSDESVYGVFDHNGMIV